MSKELEVSANGVLASTLISGSYSKLQKVCGYFFNNKILNF